MTFAISALVHPDRHESYRVFATFTAINFPHLFCLFSLGSIWDYMGRNYSGVLEYRAAQKIIG